MQRCQRARHNAEKNSGAGAQRRQPPRRLAVIRNEKLRYRRQSAAAQRHRIKNRHEHQRDTAAQRKPPRRQPQLKAELRRAHRRRTADNRADNRAGHHACARAAAADIIVLRGLHLPRCQNTRQHCHQQGYYQAKKMRACQLHFTHPLSIKS